MSKNINDIVIPEDEVTALLEEVREQLAAFTKSEKVDLVKAEDEKKEPKKEGSDKDDSKGAEVKAEDSAPEGDIAADAPATAADPVTESALSAPDEVSPEESAEEVSPEAPADDLGDGAIEPAPTVAELQAEYEKLSDEELALHMMACKAAAHSRNAAAPAPELPPANPPVAPPQMAMSEPKMEKSEKDLELEKLKLLVEKQEKAITDLTNYVAKPFRKSAKFISEVEVTLPQTEVDVKKLSKSELTEKLADLTRRNDLKKSDRELINDYYAGAIKVEKLAHLLK